MTKTIYAPEYRILLQILKDSQKKSNLTQIDIAKKLGKNQSYVSKILSGERRIDVFELMQLVQVLDLEIVDLLQKLKTKV